MTAAPDFLVRDRDGLAKLFRHYAEVEAPRMDSRVYAEIARGVADDDALLDLAGLARPDQPPPNVLFAAVQDLLLRGDDESGEAASLARFYPAVSGGPIPDASPWAAFRDFCRLRRDRLEPIVRGGRTQTCVVHRCAPVLAALAAVPGVAAHAGCVGLLEIGPSAGLNLRLDRYRYDFGGGRVWGHAAARPRLEVETRGPTPPPLPDRLEVRARLGIDVHPLDPSDPDAARWLRALVWPEHVGRLRAMDEALAEAGRVPAEIGRGDATREIGEWIARLPEDAARVVFATHVLYQMTREGRRALLDGLARASAGGPIDLVLMESSGRGDSRLETRRFEDGEEVERRVRARCDSHGRWIAWGVD